MSKKVQDSGGQIVGKVKWFDDSKGYGFITCTPPVRMEDGTTLEDVFVHFSGILGKGHKKLLPNQEAKFYIEESKLTGRPNAVMVEVVGDAPMVSVAEQFLEDLKKENERLKAELRAAQIAAKAQFLAL